MKIEKGILTTVEKGDIKDGHFIFPAGVTCIGKSAFFSREDLVSITIPHGVIYIMDGAFFNCNKLASLVIPDTVTFIGESAFFGCCELSSIIMPDNITYIGEKAFYACSKLSSITIPNKLGCIRESTFSDCSNINSISLSENTGIIHKNAFHACPASIIRINTNNHIKYSRILALLPENLQQTIQSNQTTFKEKATLLLASRKHNTSFFGQHLIPDEIIRRLLINLGRQYGIPTFMLKHIPVEMASNSDDRTKLTSPAR